MHSGLYLRPLPLDGIGYTVGGSETAGASYAEYKLIGERVNVENVVYRKFSHLCVTSYFRFLFFPRATHLYIVFFVFVF